MKKVITLFLVICAITYTFLAPASATEIAPMANNYSSAKASLVIVKGEATVTGKLYGFPGTTTKATVHLYLQQYRNGTWTDYDDWLESVEATNCTVNKTVSVPKGYQYRAKASCYAYAGSKSEHVTKYSAIIEY